VYAWITEKGESARRVSRLWKFQASEIAEWMRSGEATQSPCEGEGE
jgi:hypothetical protein